MPPTTKDGLGETLDNQRLMKLVEEALQHPESQRRAFLREQCDANTHDFEQAWNYVEWEQRMQGFLLEPLIKRDEAEPQLAAGELLDNRFRIVREVAQGGMGIVYEAQDERLKRRIALKCAKAGFGSELPPEVRHATEVSHPNVCKIYEIHTARVQQQLVDFITMEFLEGETLADRLQNGRLPRDEAVVIARQLAAGVAEAHRKGIIHGDIKSNNVILTKVGDGSARAVITDFGLARMQGAALQGVWGTPGYMAPELWYGQPPSVASDIYALGVVIFEMATGRLPDHTHSAHANSQTLKATPWLEGALQKPASVNLFWDRILGRCLDPDPKKRYETADELAAALAPRHIRRNSLLTTAAILAALLASFITYKGATAPAETVRLALAETGAIPLPALEREVGRVSGTRKIAFELLPANKADEATHVLHVTTTESDGQTKLHAVLSDAQSQTPVKTWDALYAPGQAKYQAKALAGVVSAGLHLTPTPESSNIRGPAKSDYLAGMSAMKRGSAADEALAAFEKASAADNDSPLVWAGLAEAQWSKYNSTHDESWLARASESERQAELRYLDTGAGHRIAARLETGAGQFEMAQADLERAIELEPRNAESYRRLGYLYQRNNQIDQALRALRKAVELEPKNFRNQWNLASFYLDQGRYKEAIDHLQETVRLVPSLRQARYDLALAYTSTGAFGQARESLNAVTAPSAQKSFQLGTILMYERRDSEAVHELLSAAKQAPNDFATWMELAVAQRRTGRYSDSQKSVETGLRLTEGQLVQNPRDGSARAFLSYFCALSDQKDRSKSEIRQALQLAPHQLNVLWMAVATYEALGEREQTLAILRGAPLEMLNDLKRWPDMAELAVDPRFLDMIVPTESVKEKRNE